MTSGLVMMGAELEHKFYRDRRGVSRVIVYGRDAGWWISSDHSVKMDNRDRNE